MTQHLTRFRMYAAVLAAAVLPVSVRAQQPMGETFPITAVPSVIRQVGSRSLFATLVRESAVPVVTLLPAMRVQAGSGSIAVLRIPVPAAFRVAGETVDGVSFQVFSGRAVRVLGNDRGAVGGTEPSVRVTLNVLRSAHAGRTAEAMVEFSDATGRVVGVPLDIDVPEQRHLQLVVPDAFLAGVRGTWTAVRYEIRNAGNNGEQVVLSSVLPQGWRVGSDDLSGVWSIASGDVRRGALRLWIPPGYALGQSPVRLVLSAAGAIVASTDVYVDVRETQTGVRTGPQMALTAVAAAAPDGQLATGYIATVNGAIADSVFVSARVSMASVADNAAGYGLARAGAGYGPPVVSLKSPHLDITAGALGLQQSELGGFFLNALGAASTVRAGSYSMGAFASRPFGFSPRHPLATAAGRFTGAEVARRDGWGTTRLQGVSLRDGVIERTLDALSVSTEVASLGGGQLVSEVGYRSFTGGSGIGVAGNYRRARAGSLLDLRVMHAPGGSRAFARATDDIGATLSQRVTPNTTVSAGGWRQHDDNSTLGALDNTGWFVNPMFDIRSLHSTIGIEGRGTRFSSAGAGGRFENAEQQLAGLLDGNYGPAYTSVRVGYGRVLRSIGLAQTTLPDAVGRRLETRVASGLRTGSGQFELLYLSQQYSGADALFPEQQSVTARLDRVPLPFLAAVPVFLNGDAQRFVAGTSGAATWSARGGLSATLPGMLGGVAVQAEYNPFIMAIGGGRRGLLYTLRLDRTIGLPRFAPARDQRVFVDANGNGMLDRGERRVPRAVVECGQLVLSTDAEGRFACPAGVAVQVDPRSVPVGLLAPPVRRASASRGDIALRPVQSRVIKLFVAPADSMRVSAAELSKAIVIARDAAGTLWVARAGSGGEFSFDALPPASYELEVDASAISEPLRPASTPTLIIRDGEVGPPVQIEMKARDIRVKQLGARARQVPSPVGGTLVGPRTNQRTQQ